MSYKLGYESGLEAEQPMPGYDMSMKHRDYALGYVVGFAEKLANFGVGPYQAAYVAGQLVNEYWLDYDTVKSKVIDGLLHNQKPEALRYFEDGHSSGDYYSYDEECE